MNRVHVSSLYRFQPAPIDFSVDLEVGTIVRVINLRGCPKANTMGHCYIEHIGGEFIQLVCTGSLQKLNYEERKAVKRARTPSKYRRPTPRFIYEYSGVERPGAE